MEKGKNGNAGLVIVLVVLVAAFVVGVYLVQKSTNILPQAQNQGNQSQAGQSEIKNNNDLVAAGQDLDNTDLNNIDNQLNQNDQDLSNF